MAIPVDYYEILQVSQHATLQEIKTAFRRLARQYHPDLHPNQTAAVEKFKEICQAYEILSDPQLRQQYDREISLNSSPSNQVGTSNVNGREFYHRGVERTQERDHQAAIENYSKTIQDNPNFWEAYLNRARAYYHLFKDNLVLEDCQNVLRLKPNCERAYYYLGLSRQRLGYTQSAIDAYSQAIQIDDRLPQFYYHRGLAYEELQNYAQAVNDFRIAIRLFQKNRDFSQINFLQQKVNRLSKKQFKFQEQWIKNIFDHTFGIILKFMLTSWLLIKHPKEGLLLAFMSLSKRQAFIIGLIYGSIAVLLGNSLTILPPTNRLFLSFLIFWLPYLSSGLGRQLTRSYGYLSGDVFLGGFISLLISIVFYINLSQIRLPEIALIIITLTLLVYISHSLKNGYTQIANIPTKPAIFLMMAMLSLIVYFLIL